MAGDVLEVDRVLTRDTVQVSARGMTALREERVVIAAADDPFAGLFPAFRGEASQLGHQFVDGRDGPDGRPREVREAEARSDFGKMPVPVDEAREQGAVAELGDFRRPATAGEDLRAATGGKDSPVANSHRFDARRFGLHRQDAVSQEDAVDGAWLAHGRGSRWAMGKHSPRAGCVSKAGAKVAWCYQR